jgi:hypothetical protein
VGGWINRACFFDEARESGVMASIFRSEVVQMALAPDFEAPILGFTALGFSQGWGNDELLPLDQYALFEHLTWEVFTVS